MHSDHDMKKDFTELVARGRRRTWPGRPAQNDPHYISVDGPSFLAGPSEPSPRDEHWWASSFIEDSHLPSTQADVDHGSTSLHQGGSASAAGSDSSSSSSVDNFVPASAALAMVPDHGAEADTDYGPLSTVNFNRGAPVLTAATGGSASAAGSVSSSSSSVDNFVPASAALPMVPVGSASAAGSVSSSSSSFDNFVPASAALPMVPGGSVSVKDSGSSSSSSVDNFVPPSTALADDGAGAGVDFSPSLTVAVNRCAPKITAAAGGGASAAIDHAPLPMSYFSQGTSASPAPGGGASAAIDHAPLPMSYFSQGTSASPAPGGGVPADIDFGPLSTVNFIRGASASPVAGAGASANTDLASLPVVNFSSGLSMFPAAAAPRQRDVISSRGPRPPFRRRPTRARRALRFDSPISSRSPSRATAESDPAGRRDVVPAASLTGVGASADINLAPLPVVNYTQGSSVLPAAAAPRQRDVISRRGPRPPFRRRTTRARRALRFDSPISSRSPSRGRRDVVPAASLTGVGASADTNFAPLPVVNYTRCDPVLPAATGVGASVDTDFAPLPVVNYTRCDPLLPAAAGVGASADTDFAPLPVVNYTRCDPVLPAAAGVAPSADTDFAPLPVVNYTRCDPVLPAAAVPQRRNGVLRRNASACAPFQLRPTKSRRALRFASPISSRPPSRAPAGRRGFDQAAVSTRQDPDKEKSYRVIGEIAFQLDRRILSYIFVDEPRLYGYRIADINERINEAAGRGGQRDAMLAHATEIMDTLRHLGYCPEKHSTFSEFIVNTYGILKKKPQCRKMLEDYNNRDYLHTLVVENVPPFLLQDMLVLLDSLWYLSVADGQPMFIW
ncbi:uncharacterized protein [Narcine bancroftii]|uniref:uncharacterized protein n=1 Tax=Narcine bancroftii TaxID=1343680 RepID=UPI0038312A57